MITVKIDIAPLYEEWVVTNPSLKGKVDQSVINQLCQEAVNGYLDYLYIKEFPYAVRQVLDAKYGVPTKKSVQKKNPLYSTEKATEKAESDKQKDNPQEDAPITEDKGNTPVETTK